MKKIARYFDWPRVQEYLAKLGLNLVTASLVGVFVTHTANISLTALLLLAWLGIIGGLCLLFGLYKPRNKHHG